MNTLRLILAITFGGLALFFALNLDRLWIERHPVHGRVFTEEDRCIHKLK